MPGGLSRREFAAGLATAGLASLAGCASVNALNPFSEPPITLRVYAAAGDETDVTCDLPDDAAADFPTLRQLLSKMADESPPTKAKTGISMEKGEAINDMLQQHCERLGGLYRYRGDWFFISLAYNSAELAAEHHSGTDDGHDHDHTHTHTPTEHSHSGTSTDHEH